jgi:hypothetical protein
LQLNSVVSPPFYGCRRELQASTPPALPATSLTRSPSSRSCAERVPGVNSDAWHRVVGPHSLDVVFIDEPRAPSERNPQALHEDVPSLWCNKFRNPINLRQVLQDSGQYGQGPGAQPCRCSHYGTQCEAAPRCCARQEAHTRASPLSGLGCSTSYAAHYNI